MKEKSSRFIDAKIIDDKSKESNNDKKIVVTYEEQQKDGLHRRIVYVPMFFSDYPIIDITPSYETFPPNDEAFVDLGFGSMKILSKNKIMVEDILVKERVKELTIEDIEKQLGYKIKIVDKKE